MGGFCFEVDGAPWGYHPTKHTIGSTFDYLTYMQSWLKAFPKNQQKLQRKNLSIYGVKFKFRMIGNSLEFDFLGAKGKTNKTEFLKFYPIQMYEPILVDFHLFCNELWKAFTRYEQLYKLLLSELKTAQFLLVLHLFTIRM